MKRLISISVAIVLLAVMLVLPAYAQTVDLDRHCSITATMSHNGEPVPGGTLTLYRVASLHPFEDELYRFTEEFAACGVALNHLGFDTAVDLATYVYHNDLQGPTREIDEEGIVKFEDLEVGLYLLIQWEAAEGFYDLMPFLISLPNNESGVYVYDTQSAPKQTPDERPTEPPTEPTTEPSTEPPTEPSTEPPTPPPTEPEDSNLPQTGLTNWPIPILAVCGIFFVTAGLVMVAKGRKAHDEV